MLAASRGPEFRKLRKTTPSRSVPERSSCRKWCVKNDGGVARVDFRTSNAHSGGSTDAPPSDEKANRSFRLCLVIALRVIDGQKTVTPNFISLVVEEGIDSVFCNVRSAPASG